jgi:hypothetical protein
MQRVLHSYQNMLTLSPLTFFIDFNRMNITFSSMSFLQKLTQKLRSQSISYLHISLIENITHVFKVYGNGYIITSKYASLESLTIATKFLCNLYKD